MKSCMFDEEAFLLPQLGLFSLQQLPGFQLSCSFVLNLHILRLGKPKSQSGPRLIFSLFILGSSLDTRVLTLGSLNDKS